MKLALSEKASERKGNKKEREKFSFQVQYGGRVTDDYDKRLLCTFTSVWFNPELLTADFKFFEGYGIPDCRNLEEYMEFISSLPLQVWVITYDNVTYDS